MTLTYTDDDGQVDTDVVEVSPTDVWAPTLSCPTLVSVPADPGGSTFVTVFATGADDCGTPAVVNDRTEFGLDASDVYPCGDTMVLFTATDGSGNTSTCTTTVRVADTTPPAVSCPQRVTAPADPSGTTFVSVSASASDDCGVQSLGNDRTGGGADASGIYPCGDTPVTFAATDVQGNVGTCVTTVSVAGTGVPTLGCPSVVSASSSGSSTTFVDVRARRLGDCGAMTITNDRTAGGADASDFYPCGETIVEFVGVDDLGTISTCKTTVTVLDAAGPVLDCPAFLEVPPDTPTGATVALGATGVDDCEPGVTISNDRTAGGADATDFYPCGSTFVTFSALDSVPNASACLSEVLVVPPQPPRGMGAALRASKDPLDPSNVVHFRWTLGPPRAPWEHYQVYRTSLRGRPIPPYYVLADLTAQQFTDDAAAGDLLFYEILTADCSGDTAP